jgi:hypothetical protein
MALVELMARDCFVNGVLKKLRCAALAETREPGVKKGRLRE